MSSRIDRIEKAMHEENERLLAEIAEQRESLLIDDVVLEYKEEENATVYSWVNEPLRDITEGID